jgi:hypothetical protein
MTPQAGGANTVFTGEIKDQAMLYGLLDRVRDLGLELISVQRHDMTSIRSVEERM